jgi:hypothetical protein
MPPLEPITDSCAARAGRASLRLVHWNEAIAALNAVTHVHRPDIAGSWPGLHNADQHVWRLRGRRVGAQITIDSAP